MEARVGKCTCASDCSNYVTSNTRVPSCFAAGMAFLANCDTLPIVLSLMRLTCCVSVNTANASIRYYVNIPWLGVSSPKTTVRPQEGTPLALLAQFS
jgi:hypothetical protein